MKMKNGSSRRGFVKTLAIGGAAGSLLQWTANAGPLVQNVSTETSDGKTKYGKCLVKLPIRKMGESSMFSAGADILNGFPVQYHLCFWITGGAARHVHGTAHP